MQFKYPVSRTVREGEDLSALKSRLETLYSRGARTEVRISGGLVRVSFPEVSEKQVEAVRLKTVMALDREEIDVAERTVLDGMGHLDALPQKHVLLGEVYSALKQTDRVCDECIEALRLNPDDTEALILMGSVLHDRGERETGDDFLRRATERLSRRERIRTLQAGALSMLGENTRAAAILEPLHGAGRLDLQGYLTLSLVMDSQNRTREAFDTILEGLVRYRHDPEATGRWNCMQLLATLTETLTAGRDLSDAVRRTAEAVAREDGHGIRISRVTDGIGQGETFGYASYWAYNGSSHSTVAVPKEGPFRDYSVLFHLTELRLYSEAARCGRLCCMDAKEDAIPVAGKDSDMKTALTALANTQIYSCRLAIADMHATWRIFNTMPEARPWLVSWRVRCELAEMDFLDRIGKSSEGIGRLVREVQTVIHLAWAELQLEMLGFSSLNRTVYGKEETEKAHRVFLSVKAALEKGDESSQYLFMNVIDLLAEVGLAQMTQVRVHAGR